MFLYKLYDISLEPSRPTTLESFLLKEEVNNLEKTLKILQSSTKTIPFLPPAHYKMIQQDGEKNIPIKMYSGRLPHELFFIALNLQGTIFIGPTKKLVASYIIGDLAFLD